MLLLLACLFQIPAMLLVAFMLVLPACGYNVVTSAERVPCTSTPIRLDVADEGAEWLSHAVEHSINFWSTKGVCFERSSENPEVVIEIAPLENGWLGLYHYTEPGRIQIDPKVCANPGQAACVMAHELGHHLGMDHTETKYGVMYYQISALSGCFWSNADEIEFQRAMAEEEEEK